MCYGLAILEKLLEILYYPTEIFKKVVQLIILKY